MVIESEKMLLKYVSSLAPHYSVGPDVAPQFLHARNATGWQWYQRDRMHLICISLHTTEITENHHSIFAAAGRMCFCLLCRPSPSWFSRFSSRMY